MSAPTLPLDMTTPAAKQQGSEAIRFENVTLAFDDKVVLDDISFRLAARRNQSHFRRRRLRQEHDSQAGAGIDEAGLAAASMFWAKK